MVKWWRDWYVFILYNEILRWDVEKWSLLDNNSHLKHYVTGWHWDDSFAFINNMQFGQLMSLVGLIQYFPKFVFCRGNTYQIYVIAIFKVHSDINVTEGILMTITDIWRCKNNWMFSWKLNLVVRINDTKATHAFRLIMAYIFRLNYDYNAFSYDGTRSLRPYKLHSE